MKIRKCDNKLAKSLDIQNIYYLFSSMAFREKNMVKSCDKTVTNLTLNGNMGEKDAVNYFYFCCESG